MRRIAVALILSSAWLASCGPEPSSAPERPMAHAPFAPQWEAARQAQALRLDRLDRVYASGPVELRWTDEDGGHFETCRGELFLRLPSETALVLKKVGEQFLWLGSDARRRWLFDLRAKEVVLWLVDLDRPSVATVGEAPFPIRRVALVDLLGLVELPEAEELDAIFDGPSGILIGEFFGDGGPIRVTIDTRTNLPVQVEALDEVGRPFLRGTLERYDTVERHGLGPAERPRFPGRAVIEVLEPDAALVAGADEGPQEARSEVRLFLTPSVAGEDRVTDPRFDLDLLIRSLKPARTEQR